MSDNKKRIFIVDGYGQIYRSYFAFMNNPLRDREGNNVSAVFGFFNTVMSLVRQYGPDYLVVAMDSRGKTFRHEMYDQYKANREKAPEDLHSQVPVIESFLDGMGIFHFERQGMEADDIIATIAKRASTDRIETVMVTGDKDLLQLVRDDVFALRPPRKGEKEYRLCGAPEVMEIFGVRPDQIVDYLTILGDSSDNVPGIDGIGEKGAVKLLSEYGTLDNVYSNIASLSKGVASKLEAARDHIDLSRTLVMLKDDVFDESEIDFSSYSVSSIDWTKGVELFRKMGSETLAKAAQRLVPASQFSLEAQTEEKEMEPGKVQAVVSEKGTSELEGLLSQIPDTAKVAVCLGLSDEDDMKARILSVDICAKEGEVHRFKADDALFPVLSKHLSRFSLAGQNLKSIIKVLGRYGVRGLKPCSDTMIASWLLNTSLTRFPREDCSESFSESASLEKELEKKGLIGIYRDMEVPLISVLSDMESRGIALRTETLSQFGDELEKKVDDIQNDIYSLCGKSFNLNSPKQLQEVLFVDRNLPTGKKVKQGFSTDSDILEYLAETTEDPVPAMILRYRAMSKLLSTYVRTLPLLIDPETGRIHTTFLQTGTATGRLSSKNPNLQNIPVRTEEGRRIRDAFVPQKGCLLMSADYSQIELVVLAHITGDVNLRNAFLNGSDIHRETAALIHGVFPEMVTPQQRRTAKAINFGIMYGMSPFRLSNEINVSVKEAKEFIDRYFEQYSSVASFIEKTHEQARTDGFVRTEMGHIRYIPEINSSNKTVRSAAERVAVNTVIQGTAAEIMKKAMLSLHEQIAKAGLKSRLLLQVHDEVIFEVPEDEKDRMEKLVGECMENAYKLSVPLRVSIEFGKSWGEMH